MKIVGLGDSTTAGTPGFFSPRERPPDGHGNVQSQYAYWIQQRHPEWQILNRGVRGSRTDQILRRFSGDVPPQQPDMVIILGGVNDIHQDKELTSIQHNLTQLYDLSLKEKAKVMACTILPLDILREDQKEKIREMNRWIRETAKTKGLLFCDTHAALEDPARPGFLKATPDEIHPDVEGYKRMGEAIAAILEKDFSDIETRRNPA
jgi:acyl-CoA thioesterase-1